MDLFEKIYTANDLRRTLRVRLFRIIQKINPAQPLISQESFETNLNDPQTVNHMTVKSVVLLDCGHSLQRATFPVQCSCNPPKTFCSNCGIKLMKTCSRCAAPIFPCCSHYSYLTKKYYCNHHRWSWLVGI